MTRFRYHASPEQHSPHELLAYVQLAEQACFAGARCSDHLHIGDVYLLNVTPHQRGFIDLFEQHVLPALRANGGA